MRAAKARAKIFRFTLVDYPCVSMEHQRSFIVTILENLSPGNESPHSWHVTGQYKPPPPQTDRHYEIHTVHMTRRTWQPNSGVARGGGALSGYKYPILRLNIPEKTGTTFHVFLPVYQFSLMISVIISLTAVSTAIPQATT